MAFIEWNESMSVGVGILDNDHKYMISIVNELHEGIVAGHDKEILGNVLHELIEYTIVHFAREEEMFERTEYPAASAEAHRSEHRELVARVTNVVARYDTRPVALLDLELMSFLQNWLVTHIQGTDKKYTNWFNSHGIF